MHDRTKRLKSVAKLILIVVVVGAFLIGFGENTPESWIVPTFVIMCVGMLLSGLLTIFAETISAFWGKLSNQSEQ